MEDLGFILTVYVVTIGSVATMALVIIRRARRLGERLPHEDKPWT